MKGNFIKILRLAKNLIFSKKSSVTTIDFLHPGAIISTTYTLAVGISYSFLLGSPPKQPAFFLVYPLESTTEFS